MATSKPDPQIEPILDEDGNTHICAPFCQECGWRLTAKGRITFAFGYINGEGWHSGTLPDGSNNKDWQEDCTEVFGECTNDECNMYEQDVFLNFCHMQEPECKKEPNVTIQGHNAAPG